MPMNMCMVPDAEPFASRARRGVEWIEALGVARATARLWYQRKRAAKASGTKARGGRARRPKKPAPMDVLRAAMMSLAKGGEV